MGDALIVCRLCLENLFESENAKNVHHIFDEGLSNKIIILSGLDVSLRVSLLELFKLAMFQRPPACWTVCLKYA